MTTPCRPFHDPAKAQYDETLASKMTCLVDCIRDIASEFGTRPYQVQLVWTRWSGGERGNGVEEVIETQPLQPTPVVKSIQNLNETLQTIGLDEVGQLVVEEISPRYEEDLLAGIKNGTKIPDDVQFYYEITLYRAPTNPVRRRFVLRGVPSWNGTKLFWSVNIVRASSDRTREGIPSP